MAIREPRVVITTERLRVLVHESLSPTDSISISGLLAAVREKAAGDGSIWIDDAAVSVADVRRQVAALEARGLVDVRLPPSGLRSMARYLLRIKEKA